MRSGLAFGLLFFVSLSVLVSGCGVNFAPVPSLRLCSPDFIADYNQKLRMTQAALLGLVRTSDALLVAERFKAKYGGVRCLADQEPALGGPKRRVVLDATEAADRAIRALRNRRD